VPLARQWAPQEIGSFKPIKGKKTAMKEMNNIKNV